jgi:enamine deaminase RidA (YjgF/YER057c/UK114 family)
MGADARLRKLGIDLPAPPQPMGSYVTAVRSGNLLFLAGHGPLRDGQVAFRGRVGAELSLEEGQQAARLTGLNLLASTRAALGSLDRVRRVVKVLGLVSCAESFTDQPRVINGFSDLMAEVFGDAGRHARSAIGVGSLPFGIPVEIEMVVEVAGGGGARATARAVTRRAGTRRSPRAKRRR